MNQPNIKKSKSNNNNNIIKIIKINLKQSKGPNNNYIKKRFSPKMPILIPLTKKKKINNNNRKNRKICLRPPNKAKIKLNIKINNINIIPPKIRLPPNS